MRSVILVPMLFASAILSFPSADVEGQETRESLQIYYEFTPRPTAARAFEAAMWRHGEARRAEGDPWNWGVFQTIAGDNIGDFYAVTAGHRWADLDTYDANFGSRGSLYYFSDDVLATVDSVASMIQIRNEEILRLPDSTWPAQLYSLTIYHLLPDMEDEFWSVMRDVHRAVVDGDYPIRYLFYLPASGAVRPQVIGVSFYQNWAGRAEPDPVSMGDLLRRTYGEEQAEALADRYSRTIRSTENMILVRRAPESLR